VEKCYRCGKTGVITEIVEEYKDDTLGIPVVLKNSVIREVCTECGEKTIEIPGDDKLAAAVAITRILIPVRLNGQEIRFLRKAMGLKSKELAKKMGAEPATMSRWENNGQACGGYADKVLRHTVGALLRDQAPAIDFDPKQLVNMKFIGDAEETPLLPLVFERVKLKEHGDLSVEWETMDQAA